MLRHIHVIPRGGHRGLLVAGPLRLPVALGRSGVVGRNAKKEGDGGTPRGTLPLRGLWYRPDKVRPPRTRLPHRAIRPDDLWCDAPGDRNYNRPVTAPYPASHEKLWRDDDVYDFVVELGWNDRPRFQGRGSAIFMHLARSDGLAGFKPTEGCVALRRQDMEKLLPLLGPETVMVVR
ncbi:L,D-transpeptidase family protein [Terrihabitans soli]|uniref:L,D-transpeptidase family protein n=1 Tax=Terrihabitans soli TaxID=708113 RepID=UPI003B834148